MAEYRCPGLIEPPSKDELRPNRREADARRGPLAHVMGQQMVGDFGAPTDPIEPWTAKSPSSPTFTTPGTIGPARPDAPAIPPMPVTVRRRKG